MVEKLPHISLQSKICDYCRKKLAKEQPPIPEPVPETAEQQIPELSSTSPDSIKAVILRANISTEEKQLHH